MLLSRSLTSSGSRPLNESIGTRSTWCRLRGRESGAKRLYHGSSVVFQEHQSRNSEASKGLALSDNCVKVSISVGEDL